MKEEKKMNKELSYLYNDDIEAALNALSEFIEGLIIPSKLEPSTIQALTHVHLVVRRMPYTKADYPPVHSDYPHPIIPPAQFRSKTNRRLYTEAQINAIVKVVERYGLKQGSKIPDGFKEDVYMEFNRVTET